MAKVLFGPLISDARKKVGGIVFTKVRSGGVVRRKTSPTQPRTASQRNVRADFTSLAKEWAALTAAQRAGWNALAVQFPRKDKFGQSHPLSGFQMYVSINRNLNTISAAPISDPPATLQADFPGALTVVAHSAAGGTLTVAYATDPGAGDTYVISCTAQQGAGRSNVNGRYRFIATDTAAGPTDIKAAYVAKFGALVSGKQIGVLVKSITTATGAAGIPSAALVTIS